MPGNDVWGLAPDHPVIAPFRVALIRRSLLRCGILSHTPMAIGMMHCVGCVSALKTVHGWLFTQRLAA
jgi:hypothetical protein